MAASSATPRWNDLQVQYNEDSSDVHHVYDVSPDAQLVPEFKETALTTAVGKVRITMADPAKLTFGYHIIRRIE
jgi:parvulin-like peptidyl-prolyl isomerase